MCVMYIVLHGRFCAGLLFCSLYPLFLYKYFIDQELPCMTATVLLVSIWRVSWNYMFGVWP